MGRGPNKALSIDRDFDPVENVKVLKTTVVLLYNSRALSVSAVS